MSDRYIEKTFLYLLLISLLLHLGLGSYIYSLPPVKIKEAEQPVMLDLKDLPVPPPAPPEKPRPQPKPKPKPLPKPKPVPLPKPLPKPEPMPLPKPVPLPKPFSQPVPIPKAPPLPHEKALPQARRDAAPKAESNRERIVSSRQPQSAAAKNPARQDPGKPQGLLRTPERQGTEVARGDGILKRQKGEKVDLAKLFPSARKMENLEESYRKKYRDLEQGDTRMIDTDDPLISVYAHRMLVIANGSFSMLGLRSHINQQGVGVVQVTIARDGSIEDVIIRESSKKKALDDLAVKSIREAGYIGPLPKKWPHEKLNLVWVFYCMPGGEIEY